eukprot:TRINITY_DN41533_c0_g1_i1.p1 TRINITY_DN41533_c0_g1~~TRINITY_DN41533_c0_g1_i1.p1  ORF type:complete len:149 (+),score=15.03 TRINITY_DN41533_c0_g1_i1:73-519(+)
MPLTDAVDICRSAFNNSDGGRGWIGLSEVQHALKGVCLSMSDEEVEAAVLEVVHELTAQISFQSFTEIVQVLRWKAVSTRNQKKTNRDLFGDAFDQAVGVGASTIELSQIDDLIETFDLNLRLSRYLEPNTKRKELTREEFIQMMEDS